MWKAKQKIVRLVDSKPNLRLEDNRFQPNRPTKQKAHGSDELQITSKEEKRKRKKIRKANSNLHFPALLTLEGAH